MEIIAEGEMKLTGTLRIVVAIGGETTGIIVETTKNDEYELDFSKNKKLAQKLQALEGKQVIVEGTLEIRQGVEKERKIIITTSLEGK